MVYVLEYVRASACSILYTCAIEGDDGDPEPRTEFVSQNTLLQKLDVAVCSGQRQQMLMSLLARASSIELSIEFNVGSPTKVIT